MIGKLENLMHIEGKTSYNFTGMASKETLESYIEKRGVAEGLTPEQLWSMIFDRGSELGISAT